MFQPAQRIQVDLSGLTVQNYKCGSPRNYSDYCSEEIDRLIDEQSQTLDPTRRLQLVNEIDRKLQLDGARPILGWSTRYIVAWPFIKNLVPHQSLHSNNRMQEVWLESDPEWIRGPRLGHPRASG